MEDSHYKARLAKGTILLGLVRMIRSNKDRDWLKYLTPDDWAIINGRILAAAWYPLATFQRCGWAAFQELAGGNLETVRQQGKVQGFELFGQVYKIIFEGLDPAAALERFCGIYNSFFNFSSLRFESMGKGHARVFHDYDPDDPTNVPYCHQLMGYFDPLVELAGGGDPRIELSARQWDGAPATVFEIHWS